MNKLNINQILLFCFKMFPILILSMVFLIVFSRLTKNYEISLAYIAIGLSILMWAIYKFIEKGVDGEK